MDEGRSTGLFTDLYEFTMAQSYLEHSKTGTATFELLARDLDGRGYLVAGGVDEALHRLERFHLDDDQLDALAEQGLAEELVDELATLDLADEVEVRGIQEGRLVFAHEPILQVTGPLPWAQLAETLLINAVHVGTLVTTKAARCVHAARAYAEDPPTLVDFGARRAHGPSAARAAARGAYVAGFAGTSLVEAAHEEAIPCFGTMAHSYVQAFEDEADALEAFARSFPEGTTLLVDTYDTLEGAEIARRVAETLEAEGGHLGGVRLDSGDLVDLSKQVRRLLDEAGHEDVDVFASGGLDEHAIRELLEAGAPIDGMGVGTRLVTSSDRPSLDLAYKLVEYEDRPVTKLSPGKQVLPGRKQVFRARDADGGLAGDTIALAGEALEGAPVLEPLQAPEDRGQAVQAARERFEAGFQRLPAAFKRLEDPDVYPVDRSSGVDAALEQARKDAG